MIHDVVGLLKMIHDIAHNHDKSKLGLMAIIECDLELALGFQGDTKDCDDFMAVLKVRADTIRLTRDWQTSIPGM